VILIEVPALNDRKEDIPLLCDHFLAQICNEQGIPVKAMEQAAYEELQKINWTGNIRELRNIVERLVILSEDEISASDIKKYSN
jgi:DNA-binding NtrC family response regulator